MSPHSGVLAAFAAVLAMPVAVSAQEAADIEMWRLDCGTLELSDTGPFSDTHLYDGQPRRLTDSCYLIRNGTRYLLWDTGLSGALKGTRETRGVFTSSVDRTIVEQLGDLGLAPEDVAMVGISHYHNDHIGQAADFPHAELLIGAGDAEAVIANGREETIAQLAPWFGADADGKITRIAGDHDVFGDGTVRMIATHGHTPGHKALVVELPRMGTYMLTGDLYHFEEQIENEGVPTFNTDRADTLASFHRFNQMADSLDATVVVQHEPRHIERLPAFPESAN